MNYRINALFTVFVAIFILSCKPNRLKVNVSGITEKVEIVRFDDQLFEALKTDSLAGLTKLSNKYPGFFDLFTYQVIRIGGMGDEQFLPLIRKFTTDTLIINLRKRTNEVFGDFKTVENELNTLFKHYKYYYPEKPLPTVFTYVSGFNQSVVTAENIIGISLDKYLGRDCSYYQKLSTTPQYKVLNMHKNKIVSDVAFALGISEFGERDNPTNLIGNMIYQGKMMYFVDAMLPETHDSLKIGYTTKQLEWCTENEAQMWTYLVEKKMLFSNKRMDIVRYTHDGPTTSGFPLSSPGRTGIWIGWQIVRKYMETHPEITVQQLMENKDYQQILNDSNYFPED